MLKLHNYKKAFGKVNLFNMQDLEIDKGISIIKGINGSGKTTFLRCLAGLSGFDGSITLNKYEVRNDPLEYRKRVSFCMSEPVFPGYLSAREVISFTEKARGAKSKETYQMIDTLGIEEFIDRKMSTYSSGMLKKTGLVIAFISKHPDLILLDEPFSSLDSETIPKVRNLIHQFQKKHDSSFIITSHLESELDHLKVDRIYIVEDQRLVKK